MPPALLCLEFDSIAIGILAGDALIKRAPVAILDARHIAPGRYLLIASGEVAALEESRAAALEVGAAALLDETFLPFAHDDLYPLLRGERLAGRGEALGIVETNTVAACVRAADAAAKESDVRLIEMHLANQLGGKAYVLLQRRVAVELHGEPFDPLILNDRIGEVCMVIRRKNGKLLTAIKTFYPPGAFRLLTGGIAHGESIEAALLREVDEETGLDVIARRFLAVIEYQL